MQRNASASFGLATLLTCSFALKTEKESSQLQLSYISSASILEMLLPYWETLLDLILVLSNNWSAQRPDAHHEECQIEKYDWSGDKLTVREITLSIVYAMCPGLDSLIASAVP